MHKITMDSGALSTKIVKALQSSKLSDNSKKQYISRLEKITKLSGDANAWTAITKHIKTISALQAKYGEQPTSMHMFATSILTCFKHMPELKELAPVSYKAWVVVNDAAMEPLEHHAKIAKPTKRQEAGVEAFEVIVAMRESLPVGSKERLMLSMYSLIPPRRVDYANLRIHSEMQPEKTPGNYLILPARGAGVAELVMNAYKTQRIYGQVREDLPAALVSEIRASLKLRPREYLFMSTRDRQPYKSEAAFGAWVNGTLKRLFNKPLTITLIRHSYLSFINFEELPYLVREDIARRMQHSVVQQLQYKFILPK